MKTTLALLCGGISSEDYLSRRSCKLLLSELPRNRYDFSVLDWQRDGTVLQSNLNEPETFQTTHPSIVHCFAEFKGDVVVNLTHGENENCGQLQGLLELSQIPYTGNGLTASVIGMNKELSKKCFRELNISCSTDFFFQPATKEEFPNALEEVQYSDLQYPLILKPLKGGSSEGIHLVRDKPELEVFITTQYDGTPYIFEEFIPGDDYCVGVFSAGRNIEPLLLPLAQINYPGVYFDAAAKYDGTYSVEFPASIGQKTAEKMRDAALKMHRFIGCSGFSRTDFIVHGDDIFALEINTHPGMSKHSIIPNMVKHAGHSLGSLFEQLIEDTVNGV